MDILTVRYSFRSFLRSAIGIIIAFAICFPATAQSSDSSLDQLLQIGIPNNSAVLKIPLGQVSLQNGNVHLEIPITTIPQPSGQPLTYKLVYDSKTALLYTNASFQSYWTISYLSGWHWEVSQGGRIDKTESSTEDDTCGYASFPLVWSNFRYSDSSGTTHVFPFAAQTMPACYSGTTPFPPAGSYAMDGSGYYLKVTLDNMDIPTLLQVWDPHGNLVASTDIYGGVSASRDTNGNIATQSLPVDSSNNIIPPTGYTLSYDSGYINTNYGGNGMEMVGASNHQLSSVTLPDGRSYGFEYDLCSSACASDDYHYGALKKLTLPTGQQITFNYQNINTNGASTVGDLRATSISESGESVANCAPQSTWSGTTWSICYHLSPIPGFSDYNMTSQVDVTAPPNSSGIKNQTVYVGSSMSGDPSKNDQFIPSQTTIYSGLSAPGNLLRQFNYSYDEFFRITDVATSLDDHSSSHTSYEYWARYLPMVKTKKEYDFSGQLQRETDSTYTTNYGNQGGGLDRDDFPHIVDRTFSTSIYGPSGAASGNPWAQILYGYDSTQLTTTSGATSHSILGLASHDDANFGTSFATRGNLTYVSRMVNPGQYISSSRYYNTLGELVSAVDEAGNTTQYDWYSSAWGDASCAGSLSLAYRFLTINPLGHQVQTIYNSCDGTVHAIKTQNDIAAARSGTVYTYDGSERITRIDFPDAGWETTDYGGNLVPEIITTSSATDSTTSGNPIVSTEKLDSLGRTSQISAPGGIITDTSYDNLGNIFCVSNPYIAGTSANGSICNYYDALMRKTSQIQQDGGSRTWQYTGRQVDLYDESQVHWRQKFDALGRLTQMFEMGTSAQPINFETDYTYSPLNNLICVDQWGAASAGIPCSSVTKRTFQYDSLSRLTNSSNPESGVLSYLFTQTGGGLCAGDSNSPCSRTDARNVTVSYKYDSLSRLTGKSYSNDSANTPSTCFLYDGESNGGANTIGERVSEWTQPGSCPSTSAGVPANAMSWKDTMSYDAMGRLTDEVQCPVAPCLAANPMHYRYDLLGNILYSANGVPNSQSPQVGFTNSYDNAGRLFKIVSDWDDPAHPQTLFEADKSLNNHSPYGPFGLTAAQFGIASSSQTASLSLTQDFDQRGRLVTKTVTATQPPTMTLTRSAPSIQQGGTEVITIATNCQANCGNGTMLLDGAVSGGFAIRAGGTNQRDIPTGGLNATTHVFAVNWSLSSQPVSTSFDVFGPPLTTINPTVAIVTNPVRFKRPVTITGNVGYTGGSGDGGLYADTTALAGFTYNPTNNPAGALTWNLAPLNVSVGIHNLTLKISGDATHPAGTTTIPFEVKPNFTVTASPSIRLNGTGQWAVSTDCASNCGSGSWSIDTALKGGFSVHDGGTISSFFSTIGLSLGSHNLVVNLDNGGGPVSVPFSVTGPALPVTQPVISISPDPVVAGQPATATVSFGYVGGPGQGSWTLDSNTIPGSGFSYDPTSNPTGTTTVQLGGLNLSSGSTYQLGVSLSGDATHPPASATKQFTVQ